MRSGIEDILKFLLNIIESQDFLSTDSSISVDVTIIPEPASLLLLGTGFLDSFWKEGRNQDVI